MARKLGDLKKQMLLLSRTIDEEINKVTKEVADRVLVTAIIRTPVDTSAAKSNWQVALGGQKMYAIPAHFLGKMGSTSVKSQSMAYELGADIIKSRKPGEPIHIYNKIHYIDYLESGSSMQAPRGMLRYALKAGNDTLKMRMRKINIKL